MRYEYKNLEYRLHESLVQVQNILSILEFDDELVQLINRSKDALKNKQYNIAVMGEFKRGKSSLINALLGSKILPADATPTTATVNRITYGREPKASIKYNDGSTEEININDLDEYVTKRTPKGEVKALAIKEAIISYPTVICQNHIDIIDTPGLNDEERMTQITLNMIQNVDAVIVPIHAKAPFSETEKKFVCQLIEQEGIQNIVFVVTFLDQLEEDDYEYDAFMEHIKNRIQTQVLKELHKREKDEQIIAKAHRLLDNVMIKGISATQALQSFVSNNRHILSKSRYEDFYDSLLHTVTANQVEHTFQKTIDNIQYVIDQLEKQNKIRMEVIKKHNEELSQMSLKIDNFCSCFVNELEKVIIETNDELRLIVITLNNLKNDVARQFIAELSQIRELSHTSIETALMHASNNICNAINEVQCHAIKESIYQKYHDILHNYIEIKKDVVNKDFCILEKGMLEADTMVNGMLEEIKNVIEQIRFVWVRPVTPMVVNLANTEVINYVLESEDIAITNLVNLIHNTLYCIQEMCRDGVKRYHSVMYEDMHKQLQEKVNDWDIYSKAYQKNYSVLSKDSAQIVSTLREIWSETMDSREERE